jgi:hypothetical protein
MPLPRSIGSGRALIWIRKGAPAPPEEPALGTPTFINSAAGNTPSANNVTVNVPAGVADGNLLVAVYTNSNAALTVTPPGGWTQIADSATTVTPRLVLYFRIASSEPASYTWNTSASAAQDVLILAYDQMATSPLDGTVTTNTGTATTATATGLTTTNDNSLLVMAAISQGTRTYSATNLTTEQYDGSSSGGGHVSVGVFDGVQTTAGASGNKTATISSSATWYAMLAAFKPSGGV